MSIILEGKQYTAADFESLVQELRADGWTVQEAGYLMLRLERGATVKIATFCLASP